MTRPRARWERRLGNDQAADARGSAERAEAYRRALRPPQGAVPPRGFGLYVPPPGSVLGHP